MIKAMANNEGFSKKWMLLSMAIFIASEILIGYVIGTVIVGKYVSMGLKFTLQGLCMLMGFYVGGFIIGIVSPGKRIAEPAVGAFASVALIMVVTLFTPSPWFHFGLTKLIFGGAIAFGLAYSGALCAEKIMGNIKK
jgi:hypothetical protein